MVSYTRSGHQEGLDCSQLPQPTWCEEQAKLITKEVLDSNETKKAAGKHESIVIPRKTEEEKMDVNSSLHKVSQCEEQTSGSAESCTWNEGRAEYRHQFVYHES